MSEKLHAEFHICLYFYNLHCLLEIIYPCTSLNSYALIICIYKYKLFLSLPLTTASLL